MPQMTKSQLIRHLPFKSIMSASNAQPSPPMKPVSKVPTSPTSTDNRIPFERDVEIAKRDDPEYLEWYRVSRTDCHGTYSPSRPRVETIHRHRSSCLWRSIPQYRLCHKGKRKVRDCIHPAIRAEPTRWTVYDFEVYSRFFV